MKTFENRSQLLLAALKDSRLSYREKMVLVDQVLLRDASRFSIAEVRMMGKEDLVDVFSTLKQLEECDYLRSVTGLFGTFDIATSP